MTNTSLATGNPRTPVLLVAYDGGAMSEAQLHLACRSANDLHASVRVLYVVVRPPQMPLQVPLSVEEEAHVDRLQERIERIAGRYGVACVLLVAQARSVGEAVISEARECTAWAIFVGLRERHRPGMTVLLSGTVRHILQHAPCPVQIGFLPANLPEGATFVDGSR